MLMAIVFALLAADGGRPIQIPITARAVGHISASDVGIPPAQQRRASAEVREKLEKLHALVGKVRGQWEKDSVHAPWAKVADGDMEVRWFLDYDGTVVPEDDAARDRPRYPSAFLHVVYDREGAILAILRSPEARAEDMHTQDDLLFDSRGRTIGHRHSYVSYVDCDMNQVLRIEVTVFDADGKVVTRTEALDADGNHTLPPGCVLADRKPEVPRSALAALRLYGLDAKWVRSQPRPK